MSSTCPTFENAPESTKVDYDGAPHCNGQHISGSGGHRVHSGCANLATWWHPADSYSYCDDHVPDSDILEYTRLWMKTFLKEQDV